MDPREQADTLLAQARARSGAVVTPDNMISPMDASNTQQIPGSLVSEIDERDPDATTVVPAEVIEEHAHPLAEPNPTRPLWPGESEAAAEEFDGILPTRTNQTGRSDLQSRLEGR